MFSHSCILMIYIITHHEYWTVSELFIWLEVGATGWLNKKKVEFFYAWTLITYWRYLYTHAVNCIIVTTEEWRYTKMLPRLHPRWIEYTKRNRKYDDIINYSLYWWLYWLNSLLNIDWLYWDTGVRAQTFTFRIGPNYIFPILYDEICYGEIIKETYSWI